MCSSFTEKFIVRINLEYKQQVFDDCNRILNEYCKTPCLYDVEILKLITKVVGEKYFFVKVEVKVFYSIKDISVNPIMYLEYKCTLQDSLSEFVYLGFSTKQDFFTYDGEYIEYPFKDDSFSMIPEMNIEKTNSDTLTDVQIEDAIGIIKSKYSSKKFKDFIIHFYHKVNFDDGSKYLIYLMKKYDFSIQKLSYVSGISRSSIKNYRSLSYIEYSQCSKETILKICACLRCYPYETINLLYLYGYVLVIYYARDYIYYKLVTEYYDKGLNEWNNFLSDRKLPLL